MPQSITRSLANSVLQGEIFWRQYRHVQKHSGGINARAKVAGALLRKDTSSLLEEMDLFIWAWPDGSKEIKVRLETLAKGGFPLALMWSFPVDNSKEIGILRDTWFNAPLPFVTDDIVILEGGEPVASGCASGQDSWIVAWKYPPAHHVANVKNIRFTFGRTGKITVVTDLETLRIDDKNVSRVSIGSVERWRTLDIASGDQIMVSLTGRGVPQIDRVVWRVALRNKPQRPMQLQFQALSCFYAIGSCYEKFIARLSWLSRGTVLNIPSFSGAGWRQLH